MRNKYEQNELLIFLWRLLQRNHLKLKKYDKLHYLFDSLICDKEIPRRFWCVSNKKDLYLSQNNAIQH